MTLSPPPDESIPFQSVFYKQETNDVLNPLSQILYDYWDTVPVIKEILPENQEAIKNVIRKAILHIMRVGIIEYDKTRSIKKFRHVFTPRELTRFIPYITNNPIKITTTYYHIQVLRENEYIKPIATIKKGKNKFTYYGRTGKIFLYTRAIPFLPNSPLRKDSFLKLIKTINPTIDEQSILHLIKEQNQLVNQNYTKIKQWIQKNAQAINASHIDIQFLFSYFEYLLTTNSKIQAINKKILSILGYYEQE